MVFGLAVFGTARGEAPWTWVSVGGDQGAIKVDTNGVILAETSGVNYTFNALCVNAFTGDLMAWYDARGDNNMQSRLYRFDASGGLLTSLTGLRQYGSDGLPQKKMALDCLARDVVYVTGGAYYAGWYQGIQRFSIGTAALTQTLDLQLAANSLGRIALDTDVLGSGSSLQSVVYVGLSGQNPGNVRLYAADSDFSTISSSNTVNNARRIAAMAVFHKTATMATIGLYNQMTALRTDTLASWGSTPNTAPNPPFGTSPQDCPSTNGLWWSYFVSNPNYQVAQPTSPDPKGIVVDDTGYLWLSTYGTETTYTNRWLIRLSLTNGVMASGFPIWLGDEEPTTGLALDREGHVWMGTISGNLYRFPPSGGTASGSGRDLVYAIPSAALVLSTNVSLTLGAGDATGYDHWRKHIDLHKGTLMLIL